MKNKLTYIDAGLATYYGKIDSSIAFVNEMQLKDKELWKTFANQYNIHPDAEDKGWRGEYWGKMMRGACLTYMYTGDKELYDILQYAVEALLETQDEYGRFSTYPIDNEFCGWDMWCRKYVLTGLQHFYKICKDNSLKEKIVTAMRRHADYICDKIGEGKLDIRKTSQIWGGVNSCSILEPIVELYKMTEEQKYLDFAKYIVSSGGCIDGNLLEYAAKENCYPYQYPEVKAYETMSFFEGVLAYYEVTGEKKYFDLVQKFVEDVYATDITIIGCAGCAGECFNNSAVKQTEQVEWEMQETCVTVTWMRLLFRLHLLTGDVKYADRIEQSAMNAMLGSLNEEKNQQYSNELKEWVDPLPFDSYSPLVYKKRGLGIGGFRVFKEGGFYGCCACIGSAGVAIMPLYSVLTSDEGIVMNSYTAGVLTAKTPQGKEVKITIESNYPASGTIKIKLEGAESEKFCLKLRKPNWCDKATLIVSEAEYTLENGYYCIEKVWSEQEQITLELEMNVRSVTLNEKTAFCYGPLVLALDEAKGNEGIDQSLNLPENATFVKAEELGARELVRYLVKTSNGTELIFTDYASCGKKWIGNDKKVSVWLNV